MNRPKLVQGGGEGNVFTLICLVLQTFRHAEIEK